jgi:multidrug resistance efflux pump
MNELEAEVAGTVREICVENGEPVEYGQVLFRIEPRRERRRGRARRRSLPARGTREFNLRDALQELVRRGGSDLHLKVGRPRHAAHQRRAAETGSRRCARRTSSAAWSSS